ncbi:MAG: NFACT family protein [Acholeplasmatales bacterium]|nr:NFACT family protein [Acholeplasmatales bacterium]
MPVDGLFIHHLVNELKILDNGKINRVNQVSPTDFLFSVRSNGINHSLFITIHTELAHMNLTKRFYENDSNITNLTVLLRKYVENGVIKSISQVDNDRIICINLSKFDEIGDRIDVKLYLELMGRHSNLVLCVNDKIITAYKYINPFESENRTVLPNINYEIKITKLNPFVLNLDELKKEFETILTPKDLTNRFNGVSSFIANYTYNDYKLFHSFINTFSPTKYEKNLYYMDINFINEEKTHYESLSELLDDYYYEKNKTNEIRVRSNNLIHVVRNKIDKYERKLVNLNNDLNDALNCEIYRIKGELLYNNLNKINKGDTSITLFNYYDNKDLIIELDPSIGPNKNASKYFQIYNKKKNACKIIPNQIDECKSEIEFYKLLESQIEFSNIDDILGIANELNQKKKNTKNKIKITTYKTNDYTIYVGKNNEQNAYLTKNLAKSSDLWFHVKDMPSSHVILSGLVNEESIRCASQICSFYSKAKYSSSVPVIYTQVKNLKRIPNKRNCFLSYANEKTIYIDPDIDYVNSLNLR